MMKLDCDTTPDAMPPCRHVMPRLFDRNYGCQGQNRKAKNMTVIDFPLRQRKATLRVSARQQQQQQWQQQRQTPNFGLCQPSSPKCHFFQILCVSVFWFHFLQVLQAARENFTFRSVVHNCNFWWEIFIANTDFGNLFVALRVSYLNFFYRVV